MSAVHAASARIGFIILAGAAAAVAVELPGVPGPPVLGPQHLGLRWGNDGFGPGGGAVSDDFRTNQVSAVWDGGGWFLAADHSMLTSRNPSGSPVAWGLPDAMAQAEAGQARRDELTVAAGLRAHARDGAWSGWLQGGVGAVCYGHLAGRELQERIHLVIGSDANTLPYEDDAPRLAALGHAGAGGGVLMPGPLRLQAGAIATVQSGGFARGRAAAELVAAGAGGGIWLGCAWTDWAGDAPSPVAAAVARHERGPTAGGGLGIDAAGVRWTLAGERNLRNDGQSGAIGIAWIPQDGAAGGTPETWSGRFGVALPDSRCGGRGIDLVLMRLWTSTWTPSLRVGYRDSQIEQPYTLDLESRRQQLWIGPGMRPELLAAGRLRLIADAEAGAGVRWSQAVANGYKTFVGGGDPHRADHAVAIARAAAGLGLRWVPHAGPALGLQLLVEGTLAPERGETVTVLSPIDGSVIDSGGMPMEGSAWGAVVGIDAGWRW